MLDLAIKSNKNNGKVEWAEALANLNLGRTYDSMGERKTALEYYGQVKKSAHKQAYNLAQERIKTPVVAYEDHSGSKSFNEIMEMYQSAQMPASENPEIKKYSVAEVMYYVAKVFYDKGVYDSAIPKFEKLVRTENLSSAWIKPWSYFYLGSAYHKMGQPEKALDNLNMAAQYTDPGLKFKVSQKKSEIGLISEK
jgi:tetratricopeptide (TPR) repeat protein